VDRLRNLPEYALCFTTPSFRLTENDSQGTLLMTLVYLDEIQVASGKTIPELAVAFLHDRGDDRVGDSSVAAWTLSHASDAALIFASASRFVVIFSFAISLMLPSQ
jgi:hypothetical protein